MNKMEVVVEQLVWRVREWLGWLSDRVALSDPPNLPLLATALLLLLPLTLYPPTWRVLRHGVTIVHEMGHVVMARLWGRRVDGIRLHTDTSGLTLSAGKSWGPGVVMTYLAGYTAPPAAGLGIMWLALHGWSGLAIVFVVLLLVCALLLVRNLWGVVTVAVALGIFGWVLWVGHPASMTTAAALAAVFLLLAGARGGFDLWAVHSRGQGAESDASMLERHTLLPAMLWVLVFTVFGVFCAGYGLVMVARSLQAAGALA